MLVLAVDTATPAVTAGLVELEPADAGSTAPRITTITSKVTVDARAHNEVLTPQILACLAESGRSRADIGAVVAGIGPGPFTGLRVGMATAAAFGDALGVSVYGVCSLDAIAADTESYLKNHADPVELLVVTDARRREVYWARYRALPDAAFAEPSVVTQAAASGPEAHAGGRIEGPEVCKPADLDPGAATVIAGSASHVDYFDLPVLPVETPSPAGLVRCAASAILSGATPEPLVPLYLRRPDAVERSYAQVGR
ncbi:tRNA (adenosine(37)-N6)-threonylcarbamoyltransferase complex dimerization subunit type 1 TsaB [Nocardia huaxiensis]|uniref:tRNA (Adenosine(37)-N6)-threonylcarbamoyltransferase complex dimerization subunit type 1 TsaB n=1 Tax=Nocardia huaxiensis TaxID=2755382 RepID=A0A7D6ZYW4_9NOCA|nr:tRNA (adenosine(37)-N6)-threonylcarbamoyltransferase complex dimerization subunit type 1 TsaB [Nocardia huaxiensis]QLY31929.1 tRNA (adenosine(37)-N6)-threonylcarbamoyltransferase complex dimerization subunit type 1 TsaB [Nocardia huaxiensis]UFS95497.1 tRNA (adenosine(37)-N6)-threonylcarbamoyltransferase complex dimerization subunit type 1 TsaB [Nocardia huaxiensis]